MSAPDLDHRIDALYAVDLDAFVAARDQLVRDLRAVGLKDAGAQVKLLRKPPRPAWGVNQAVRQAPELFDAVVEAGAALLDCQQAALEGGNASGLRDATRARQQAVRALADVAVGALGPTGEQVRDAVAQTLLAASIDPAAAEEVRSGRLSRELEPPDIFGALQPGATVPTARPRERRAKGRGETRATTPEPAPESARTRRAEAPAAAAASARPGRDEQAAELVTERAENDVTRARGEVEAAKNDLDVARRRAADLGRVAKDAAAEARAAEKAELAAAARYDTVRKRLTGAEASLRDALKRSQ
jgi:hypothetical protein